MKNNELLELKEIESIIQQDNNRYLSCEVLSHITFKEQLFPIYALSIGCKAPDAPCITFTGGVHGLERIGTQVVLTFLQTVLSRLEWDIAFEDMLQRVRINFLPLLNPVGMLNETRSNGQGIDLMRNAPVDCHEKTIWLGSGHRISPHIPWYRGEQGQPMQAEAQALCSFIKNNVFSSPFSIVLDCHSGFGYHDQIWFPYANSKLKPIKHLSEVYCLRQLFFQTYPYQNYKFEPQSQHYLTHGDLWDHLYMQSLEHNTTFLPLTLEIGSWRWIRKNPLQLRSSLGFFHPIKPHRTNRVLRGHLILMEFLVHATLSYKKWLNESHTQRMTQEAMELWYHDIK